MTIFQPGDVILNGEYRLEAQIGAGAFAEVYRAAHIALKAPRAIKVLRHDAPGVGSTEFADYGQRFQLEAQLGARLDNPHVIRVYDFRADGEMLLLIMEYAAGGSLAYLIQRARKSRQPVPIEDAIQIAVEVADGLAAIHALDVVHRDLKPSNILFDAQGRAKIGDLGLAQIPGGPSMRSRLSQSAPHPGTPAYMSPEQLNSDNYLASPSDVYALGAVLFEALTGRVVKNVRPGTPVNSLRAEAPQWLNDLLARMLADNARERPWNGAEALEALRAGEAETRRQQEERQREVEKAKQDAEDRVKREIEERKHQEAERKAKDEAERRAREEQGREAARVAAEKVRLAEAERARQVQQQSTMQHKLPSVDVPVSRTKSKTSAWLVIVGLIVVLAIIAVLASGGGGGSATQSPTAAAFATKMPTQAPPAVQTGKVGIVLPTKDEPRWVQDETRFKDAFTAAGYDVQVLFSQYDSAKEKANVEALIAQGIKVLIICPQDGMAAAAAADEARAAGVKVISYDRLILDTEAVDYYVTFDRVAVGAAWSQYLIDQAGATKDNNLYLYAGAVSDNNAFLFFQGAWETIQPKIVDGTFVIKNSSAAVALKSKATLTRDEEAMIIDQVTTNWDPGTAKNLAESNLTVAKAADKGNVFILAPNDFIARTIADAFAVDKDVKSWVITGQDAEKASVQYIIDGKQSMTVFKDVRTLVKDAVAAAVAYLEGKTPEKTNAYNNGKIDVPAKPSALVTVTKDNVKAAIFDSGYYDYKANGFTVLPELEGGGLPMVDGKVGIVLPTKDEPRWVQDETRFNDAFKAAGYDVQILFSQGDSAKEKTNVEVLIAQGIKVLIICPQDGTAAAAAADAARAAGVKVISYDRLIRDTEAVDYYVTFDAIAVGALQAQYLVNHVQGKGNPLYLYAGAASDNYTFLFFEGAWDVLQPKIADGTFVVKNSSEAVALQGKATLTRDEEAKIIGQVTTGWDPNTANNLAESNLTKAKAADKGTVFIVAPNDGTARAIADVFAADTGVSSYVITGQDAEKASVQYIIDGKQSMTVLKDIRTLVADAITAAVAYLKGGAPEQTTSYNNGRIDVPSKPSALVTVTKDNVKAAIFDSGYYSASDFTGLP